MRRRLVLACSAIALTFFIAVPAGAAAGPAGAAATHHHARDRVGEVIGGAMLVGALLFWSFGYGLLGGRITPLSTRLRHESSGRSD